MKYVFKNLLLAFMAMSFLFSSLCMYLLNKIEPHILNDLSITLGKSSWTFGMEKPTTTHHVDESTTHVIH